jgi:hypothetical protein
VGIPNGVPIKVLRKTSRYANGNTQVLEGKGKFVNRRTKTASKDYDKFFIYVPAEVARDGTFPFKPQDVLIIRIDTAKKRLVVEKAR